MSLNFEQRLLKKKKFFQSLNILLTIIIVLYKYVIK